MADTRTPEQRRRIMQSVKTKDTGPETAVRKSLFALGYRFRLHRKDLPGTPDIIFPVRKKAIFVHGCYWHGHNCSKGKASKSRTEYWGPKIAVNRARDARNLKELHELEWTTFVVWQCELKDLENALTRLGKFLGPPTNSIDKAPEPV